MVVYGSLGRQVHPPLEQSLQEAFPFLILSKSWDLPLSPLHVGPEDWFEESRREHATCVPILSATEGHAGAVRAEGDTILASHTNCFHSGPG